MRRLGSEYDESETCEINYIRALGSFKRVLSGYNVVCDLDEILIECGRIYMVLSVTRGNRYLIAVVHMTVLMVSFKGLRKVHHCTAHENDCSST